MVVSKELQELSRLAKVVPTLKNCRKYAKIIKELSSASRTLIEGIDELSIETKAKAELMEFLTHDSVDRLMMRIEEGNRE